MSLFSRLLVAFIKTAAGLLKLKSWMPLAAEITTVGAGVRGSGAGGAGAAAVRNTGAPERAKESIYY